MFYFPSLSLFRRDKPPSRGPQRVPTRDPDWQHPVAADTAFDHRIPSYLFANVHAHLSRSDRRRRGSRFAPDWIHRLYYFLYLRRKFHRRFVRRITSPFRRIFPLGFLHVAFPRSRRSPSASLPGTSRWMARWQASAHSLDPDILTRRHALG